MRALATSVSFMRDVLLVVFCAAVSGCGYYVEPEPSADVCRAAHMRTHASSEEECEAFKATAVAAAFAGQQALGLTYEGLELEVFSAGVVDGGTAFVHPKSGSEVSGYAACWDDRLVIYSTDWSKFGARMTLCHEFGHALMGCGDEAGEHAAFKATGFEDECIRVMRMVEARDGR